MERIDQRVTTLLHEMPYGVLSTQGSRQPYASLMAFAVGRDLQELAFATPKTTRKYTLLIGCPQVAFLVDNRAGERDAMSIAAATATGRAEELPPGPDHELWAARLVARHPHLDVFVRSPSCAVFRVQVARYFYVTRFQEVHEWRP